MLSDPLTKPNAYSTGLKQVPTGHTKFLAWSECLWQEQDEVISASTEWRIHKYLSHTDRRTHRQSDFLGFLSKPKIHRLLEAQCVYKLGCVETVGSSELHSARGLPSCGLCTEANRRQKCFCKELWSCSWVEWGRLCWNMKKLDGAGTGFTIIIASW